MIVLDWRGAAADVMAPVFEQERERWLRTLQWDSSRAWREVEHARTTWGLPGLLALDDGGRALGSIFYLPDGQRFDIGGVIADTPAVTAALVDRVVERAAAEGIHEVRCFAFESAPNLQHELERCGFEVERYLYLTATLDASGPEPATHWPREYSSREWTPADLPAAALLLRDAYDERSARIFAPGGSVHDWSRYLHNLIEQGACGDLAPGVSRAAWRGGRCAAAAIVTAISPGTLHLAQFAVHPTTQSRGLARQLLRDVWRDGRANGFDRITLLVAEGNTRARALYASIGMMPAAVFLSAGRCRAGQPARAHAEIVQRP